MINKYDEYTNEGYKIEYDGKDITYTVGDGVNVFSSSVTYSLEGEYNLSLQRDSDDLFLFDGTTQIDTIAVVGLGSINSDKRLKISYENVGFIESVNINKNTENILTTDYTDNFDNISASNPYGLFSNSSQMDIEGDITNSTSFKFGFVLKKPTTPIDFDRTIVTALTQDNKFAWHVTQLIDGTIFMECFEDFDTFTGVSAETTDTFDDGDSFEFAFTSGALTLWKNGVTIPHTGVNDGDVSNIDTNGPYIIRMIYPIYGTVPYTGGLDSITLYEDLDGDNNLVVDIPMDADFENKTDYNITVNELFVDLINGGESINNNDVYQIGVDVLNTDSDGNQLVSEGHKPTDFDSVNLYSASDIMSLKSRREYIDDPLDNFVSYFYNQRETEPDGEDFQVEFVKPNTTYKYSVYLKLFSSFQPFDRLLYISDTTGGGDVQLISVPWTQAPIVEDRWYYHEVEFTTGASTEQITISNNKYDSPYLPGAYYFCNPILIEGTKLPDRYIVSRKSIGIRNKTVYENSSTLIDNLNGTMIFEINFTDDDSDEYVFNFNENFYLKKNTTTSLLMKINDDFIAVNLSKKSKDVENIGVSWENGLTYRLAVDGEDYIQEDYTTFADSDVACGSDSSNENGLEKIKNFKYYTTVFYINALKNATKIQES